MPAIGIDLGTTNSCVAVVQQGVVKIIPNEHGHNTTPSWVAFTENSCLIGYDAKKQVAMNPTNTVYDVKRLIGRRFADPSVTLDRKNWSFEVVSDNDKPMISVDYKGEMKTFASEEVSSMILVHMKEIAEKHLGEKVTDAVITVPAYFDISQRQATKDAGKIAGLNVLKIISEPTAAAIAYGLSNTNIKERNVLIFDLGGGTLDVSILGIKAGEIKVKSTDGDTHLGGEDFDNRMMDSFISEFKRKHDVDIFNDTRAVCRLRAKCEQAKWTLSSLVRTNVDIDLLSKGINFNTEITRQRFEELNEDLFKNTLVSVEKCLKNIAMDRRSIDEIVVVGGSSRIPKVQQLLKDFFNDKELNYSINPDEAVAYGAAVQAALLSDPTSVVNGVRNLLIEDVVPLSLGIEVLGGKMSVVIPRNTPIPVEKTRPYTISEDNLTSVSIPVYEGERGMIKDNRLLDEFRLTDIPQAKSRVSKFIVKFKLDEDSILHVSAVYKDTEVQKSIIVSQYNDRLSKDAIDRMISDAKQFKADDEEQRECVAAKNELESYVYKTRSTITRADVLEKLSEPDRNKVIEMCHSTITWLDINRSAKKNDFRQKQKGLELIFSPILRKMYPTGNREL